MMLTDTCFSDLFPTLGSVDDSELRLCTIMPILCCRIYVCMCRYTHIHMYTDTYAESKKK